MYETKAAAKRKPEKKSGLNGIRIHDRLCDTGAVLYQLSYQANWELVVMWIHNIKIKPKKSKGGIKAYKSEKYDIDRLFFCSSFSCIHNYDGLSLITSFTCGSNLRARNENIKEQHLKCRLLCSQIV